MTLLKTALNFFLIASLGIITITGLLNFYSPSEDFLKLKTTTKIVLKTIWLVSVIYFFARWFYCDAFSCSYILYPFS